MISDWRRLLGSHDPESRYRGVEQLRERGAHSAVPELERMALHDTASVSLGERESAFGGETWEETLLLCDAARNTLAAIYAREGVLPADVERLAAVLHEEPEGDLEHEARVIRVLVLGGDAVRPVLRAAEMDPQAHVAVRALKALAELKDPDAGAEPLAHPEPRVRRAAAGLWPFPNEAWWEAAIARLAIESDASVRERLVQAASLKPPLYGDRFTHRMFPAQAGRWTELRLAALRALFRCGRDPEPAVRRAAAQWLAQFSELLQQKPPPEFFREALEWIEAETDPEIRAELLGHIPYRRWQRLVASDPGSRNEG